MDPPPVRAAGYIRVSQERSAKHGYGLGAQEQDVRRYLDYRGWPLVELYREEGVSGYRRDRPALARLLQDARAGRFSTVVFPSIDRAGRSVRDLIEIDQALHAAGVATVFLREGVDTATAAGQLFRNIMASLAEFEGKVIQERLSKGKARKAAEGGYVGGWLPYGYARDAAGRVAVVPEQAEVVRRIFHWRAQGRSLAWIRAELERLGIPTLKARRWSVGTLQGILANRFYAGQMPFDGAWVPGRHEAILPASPGRPLRDRIPPGASLDWVPHDPEGPCHPQRADLSPQER